jgi:hypothetical protein
MIFSTPIQDLINMRVKSQKYNAVNISKSKTIGKLDISKVSKLHNCLQHASPAAMVRAIGFVKH